MTTIKANAVLVSIEAQFQLEINVWPFTHNFYAQQNNNKKKHITLQWR